MRPISSIRENPVKPTSLRRAHPHARAAAPARVPASARASVTARRRLSPSDRERQIVDGAVEFFSQHGLDGQLRDLAKQLGITHTLLYHYFPTKQALIERVYAEQFAGRWNPAWEAMLDDASLDVETKFTRFYSEYASVILKSNWVRIFIFSGLSDRYITDQYFAMLHDKLFPRLVRETRRLRGKPLGGKSTERELELLLGLHGSIFYMGMRRWIYGQSTCSAKTDAQDARYIHDQVLAYLLSVSALLDM